jgi:Na+-transporting methylmalonyl-CoA/oxaloacetate decarboxylase gamma subunit
MSDLLLALQITALGMGLVFSAIILLWVMMILLTKFTADKEPAADSPEVDPAPSLSPTGNEEMVAALAVAIALAEQGLSTARPLPEPPTAIVSAWQLGMRMRHNSEKGNFRRR